MIDLAHDCRYAGTGLLCPAVVRRHPRFIDWERDPRFREELDLMALALTLEAKGTATGTMADVLVAVRDCPERGPVLPLSGCCPKYECRAGKGVLVGDLTVVNLADCRTCAETRVAVPGP